VNTANHKRRSDVFENARFSKFNQINFNNIKLGDATVQHYTNGRFNGPSNKYMV